MVYCLGGLIWAITGSGSAPDNQDDVSPTMTWLACKLVEGIAWATGSKGNGGKLQVSQVDIPFFSRDLCVGVLDLDDLDRRSIVGFQLDSPRAGLKANSKPKPIKAILWLSGGGYVTGYPLVDPPIFSIARNLPRGEYRLLAPSVRRCLSLDRAFPIPLLDALSGYEYLRRVGGYEAKDIVIMGNSAGSGLSWSLIAYLAILQDANRGDLGIPGSVIMISVGLLSTDTAKVCSMPDFIAMDVITACATSEIPRSGGRTSITERSSLLPRTIPSCSQSPRPFLVGLVPLGQGYTAPTRGTPCSNQGNARSRAPQAHSSHYRKDREADPRHIEDITKATQNPYWLA